MTNKIKSVFRAAMLLSCILCSTAVIAQAAPPAGGGPDFSHATEALGITATELATALGSPPNFVAGAEKLGVTTKELVALLPAPPTEAEYPEGFTAEDFYQGK